MDLSAGRHGRIDLILMLYTNARGGIRAVCEGYIRDGLATDWNIEPIFTHVEGSIPKRLRVFAGALLKIFRHILAGEVEAMHCHVATRGSMWRKIILCRIAAAFKVPSIMHLHGAETRDFYDQQPPWRQRLIGATLERCEYVVALSEGWKSFVLSIAPRANVRVIPNYVGMPAVPMRPSRTEARALFLGEVGQRKGVYDLLAAMKIAIVRAPNLMLYVGGNGEVDKARAMAHDLGLDAHVKFLGWISGDAKRQALDEADLYVLPSHFEGLPVSIIEAMAVELPVVSTTAGAIPEMITPMQEGIVVTPGDVPALADALVLLAQDAALRQRMGRAARQRAASQYSRDVVIPMLNDLYTACVGHAQRGEPRPLEQQNPGKS